MASYVKRAHAPRPVFSGFFDSSVAPRVDSDSRAGLGQRTAVAGSCSETPGFEPALGLRERFGCGYGRPDWLPARRTQTPIARSASAGTKPVETVARTAVSLSTTTRKVDRVPRRRNSSFP